MMNFSDEEHAEYLASLQAPVTSLVQEDIIEIDALEKKRSMPSRRRTLNSITTQSRISSIYLQLWDV